MLTELDLPVSRTARLNLDRIDRLKQAWAASPGVASERQARILEAALIRLAVSAVGAFVVVAALGQVKSVITKLADVSLLRRFVPALDGGHGRLHQILLCRQQPQVRSDRQ